MIPGAKLTVIADAGHLVNIEKPAEFNAAAMGLSARQNCVDWRGERRRRWSLIAAAAARADATRPSAFRS